MFLEQSTTLRQTGADRLTTAAAQAAGRGSLAALGIALALLAASVHTVLAPKPDLASYQAVVAAETVSLRAPVDGALAESGLTLGSEVTEGSVLAHVRNPQTSLQRLQDLGRRLDAARTAPSRPEEIATLDASLSAELRRVAQLADSALIAPSGGTVVRIVANDGARVAAGQEVAQIVDCRSSFLVVPVPKRGLAQITVGREVRVRLEGETDDRRGEVTAITMDAAGAGSLHVGLTGRDDAAGCQLGRGASVLVM